MNDLVLSGLEGGVLRELQVRADRHGRTPAEEAKQILAEVLHSPEQGPWEAADRILNELLSTGRQFSDSADLVREDRDR